MSDDRPDLDLLAKQLEELLARQLPSEQWASAEACYRRLQQLQVKERKRGLLDFAKRLKTRQGSVLPDYEALYRQKDELDRSIWRSPFWDSP